MVRKTITLINEEIYNKLRELKGDKTWDELMFELLNKKYIDLNNKQLEKKVEDLENRVRNLEKLFDALTRDEFVEQYKELKNILNLK